VVLFPGLYSVDSVVRCSSVQSGADAQFGLRVSCCPYDLLLTVIGRLGC